MSTVPNADITLHFLGVGNASQQGLGHASAVVEVAGKRLLIDCGPGTMDRFIKRYDALPDAIFVTHCHLDHIADFENFFIKSWFSSRSEHTPMVFVASALVPLLHERVGNYPKVLAEGGVNFWQAFQLVPVSTHFEFSGLKFQVIEVRHHAPGTAYGLRLPEAFFYSGDTRPIPEVIEHAVGANETIFHDCGVESNPSHTGIPDILNEYSEEVRNRLFCYHYASPDQRAVFESSGLRVISPGESFTFSVAEPA